LSEVSHFEIAAYAKKICDYTIGVGDGFKSQELDKWYQNVEQLIKDADKLFRKGDVVLVKGSLANKLNKLVEYLK
jgi:UDP-N-acetylmuramyl pentapeptide synthase